MTIQLDKLLKLDISPWQHFLSCHLFRRTLAGNERAELHFVALIHPEVKLVGFD